VTGQPVVAIATVRRVISIVVEAIVRPRAEVATIWYTVSVVIGPVVETRADVLVVADLVLVAVDATGLLGIEVAIGTGLVDPYVPPGLKVGRIGDRRGGLASLRRRTGH